jgi:glycosyltransferase involved in cell wall biosynthesis
MNCPRRLAKVPADHLAAKLAAHELAGFSAVYFHGWIGPSRCLETVIQSMRWWPARTLFVMVGPVMATYRDSLLALARQRGSESRLVFLGSVPYDEVFHLAAGAAVGCSLVADQNDPNWTYSAGAINKRFEYMAVGLPQVANGGAGMRELIEESDCGVLADPTSPEDVGRALARLLEDRTVRAGMSENSRKAHLSNFNYEYQFAPVLSQILGWCGKGKAVTDVA